MHRCALRRRGSPKAGAYRGLGARFAFAQTVQNTLADQMGSLSLTYGSVGGQSGIDSRGAGLAAAFASHSGPPECEEVDATWAVLT